MTKLTCAKSPCKSCPYRRDVPSGVWAKEEYDKLPAYDGEMHEQLLKGGVGWFGCHQQNGKLCAGWVGCHGADNLLSLQLAVIYRPQRVDPTIWTYKSPVPLFRSGAAAAKHGIRAINRPGIRARRMVTQLVRKRGRRERER